MRLSGQTHVVVGGSTRWGRAVSQQLAAEGADVAVVDAGGTDLEQVGRDILAAGGKVRAFAADIGSLADLRRVAARIDAGISGLATQYMALEWASFEDCDIDRFAQVVVHNLVGPAKAVKAFLPLLRRQGKGAILHLTSIDGVNGNPRVPSYSAAKGGIGPLTNVMAHEFAKYDIRVNALATGLTVQMKDFPPEAERAMPGFPGLAYARQLNDATPLKRYGPMTDWAKSATFLLSQDSDYMTGTVMIVDCGRLSITPGTA